MSVFSVTAIDRLIESERRSSKSFEEMGPRIDKQNVAAFNGERRPLYVAYPYSASTTPAAASLRPRTPSPSSFSPSPYVVNHKRRVPNGLNFSKRTSQQNGFHVSDKNFISRPTESQESLVESERREGNSQISLTSNGTNLIEGNETRSEKRTEMSTTGNNDDARGKEKVEDRSEGGTNAGDAVFASSRIENVAANLLSRGQCSLTSTNSSSDEWFDAPDAPLPDYSSDDEGRRVSWSEAGPSSRKEDDSSVVFQLKAEIQRRITAENAREALQHQRDGMAQMLSSAGISIPKSNLGDLQITNSDNLGEISDSETQRLMVARLVAGAVATGAVRAEAEAELITVLAEKSQEISRLKDKLQYFELVNHEMSHRNQESIENARQSRRRRQRRQRLAFFGLTAAICVGVSVALVYQYAPWDHLKGLHSGSAMPEGDASTSLEKVVESVETDP